MRSSLAAKSKIGFLAGLVLFVVGAGAAVYLVTRPKTPTAAEARVPVYFAFSTVDTGTSGAAALAAGLLRTREVAPASVPPDAVTDPSQIANGVAAAVIRGGTTVTTGMFPAPQTRIGTVVIPAGKRALALKLEPVPGVAGFAGAGDLIDVYGVVQGVDPGSSRVQMVLQAVEVLNVNGAGLAAAQGVADGPNLVYLVAVTPGDAERLIYISEFNKLYFDLVAKGEPPVVTPGAGAAEALRGV
jgi:pilus assembly protein CpaB